MQIRRDISVSLLLCAFLGATACSSTPTTVALPASPTTTSVPAPTAAPTATSAPTPVPTEAEGGDGDEDASDAAVSAIEAMVEQMEQASDARHEARNDEINEFIAQMTPTVLSIETTVVDAGAEPRSRFRITATPQCEELLSNTVDTVVEQAFDGETFTAIDTGAVIESTSTVLPHEDGFAVTESIEEISATDRLQGTEVDVMSQLGSQAATFTYVVDEFGIVDPATIGVTGFEKFPAFAQLATSVLAFLPSYPDEPVGQGAVWVMTTVSVTGGVELVVTATLTLTQVTDAALVLDIQATTEGAPAEIVDSISGTPITVASTSGVSTVSIVLDRASLIPARLVSSATVVQELNLVDPVLGELSLDQTTHVETLIETELGAGCDGRDPRILP